MPLILKKNPLSRLDFNKDSFILGVSAYFLKAIN